MYCNECKFLRQDTCKLFEGISISCGKYSKHLGFANKVKKIKKPDWCDKEGKLK